MKPELDRIKNDLETMHKAMGLAPSFGREWIQWMKRDNWLNLWWCLPGFILIASALLRLDNTKRYLGLAPNQWVGLLLCGIMVGMLAAWNRMTRGDRRPAAVVREYKRINAGSAWWALGFLVQFLAYLVWGKQHGIPTGTFMALLWLLGGSSLLQLALSMKAWMFLGWAIPLLVFGLCQPLLHDISGLWMGVMFITAALLCSVIQTWQLRGLEKQHDAH